MLQFLVAVWVVHLTASIWFSYSETTHLSTVKTLWVFSFDRAAVVWLTVRDMPQATMFCRGIVECIAWQHSCACEEGWAVISVFFMGFVPRNTMAMTVVCTLVVLCGGQSFMSFVTSLSFPHLFATYEAGDFVNFVSYCSVILFLQVLLYLLCFLADVFYSIKVYCYYSGFYFSKTFFHVNV